MIHGCLPVMGRAAPLGGDIAQRHPDQLGGGFVSGEVASGLDNLAQLRVEILDGVGRVDDLAHARGERKEGNYAIPGVTPGDTDRREFLTPRSIRKRVKLGLGRLCAGAV